jgi:hypothetical protein
MSRQTFPVFVDQPGCTMHNFSVTGASVGASAGTAGLDGRGKFLCTISKLANVVTVNWTPTFGDRPYVFPQPAAGQADTLVEIVSSTATTFVYQTFTASTHAPLNDANIDFHVDSYNTTSFVS